MNPFKFRIYNASAGSGKTYSLVQNFLSICLSHPSPNHFRSILAITFTNKAADEMKGRIIEALTDFARMPDDKVDSGMFAAILEQTKLSPDELRKRSRNVLRMMLHQYSALSVNTIDKFTNRIIRSFSHDLKLGSFYEVELDSIMMLTEAIDQMLAELDEGTPTAKVLIEFLNTQMDEGRSPRVENRLLHMAKSLFEERAMEPIGQLRHFTPEDYLEIRRKLYQRKSDLESEIQSLAKDFLDCVDAAGIDHELFSGQYIPKYLKKMVNKGSLELPSKTVVKQLSGDAEFYPKAKARFAADLFKAAESNLHGHCRSILGFLEQNYALYQLSCLVLNSIYGLAVLMEIEAELEKIKSASNVLPIGEFNKLVSLKLQQEPAAFIFEKLGDRYQNYFIDEFQDTSRLQWQNLLPLINNSLAQSGTSMLVGDGKQSIYRWRGGEVEQFIDLNTDRDNSNKVQVQDKLVELYTRESVFLPHNWRSRKNIVEFNNGFFHTIVDAQHKGEDLVQNEDHRLLFKNAAQSVKGSDGGYVNIRFHTFLSEQYYHNWQGENCLQIINDTLEMGFRLSDIAILNRKTDNSVILAEYLISQGMQVISPDSLLLKQSDEVQALISLLGIIVRPDDRAIRISLLEELWKIPDLNERYNEKHQFFSEWLKMGQHELFKHLFELWPGFEMDAFIASPLSEKISTAARHLGYNLIGNPYLHTLQDEAQNFDQHREEGMNGFLRWWESKGGNTAIELPDELDAVRMMTIHKAKGLEFPIVILPYADWMAFREREPVAWMKLNPEHFFGLPAARINLKSLNCDMEGMEDYSRIYTSYRNNVTLDNLNLLYVALTRPVDELYILGTENRQDSQRITAYLKHYLEGKDVKAEEWSVGVRETCKTRVKKFTNILSPSYDWTSWKSRLLTSTDVPLNWQEGTFSPGQWGRKMHSILAQINYSSELDEVVESAIANGEFNNTESQKLNDLVRKVINHPELKAFFEGDIQVLNEKDILLPGAGSFRPDRLVVINGTYHIIDYKTGKPLESHQQQLNGYEDVLREMGLKTGSKVLAYLDEEVEVVKWN